MLSVQGASTPQETYHQRTNSNFLSDHIENQNTTVNNSHTLTKTSINQPSNHVPTYPQATSGKFTNTDPNSTSELKNFLGEFKSLIGPRINLLNKLISK